MGGGGGNRELAPPRVMALSDDFIVALSDDFIMALG